MTVLVRSKRADSSRERRHAPAGHLSGRGASAPSPTAERRQREQHHADQRRLSNDHALYNCLCGYVFEAPVSTSVDCPHCGGTQAW